MSGANNVLKRLIAVSVLLVSSLVLVDPGRAAHGLAVDGNLKYPPGFTRFDYVSEHAVKGGSLTLHATGSFDKMNPFTLKGTSPFGLEQFVFEPLAVASLDEPFAQYELLASDIDVADDQLSVIFTIAKQARFSEHQHAIDHRDPEICGIRSVFQC